MTPSPKFQWAIATRSIFGFTLFAALLFVPAGSFHFWQGWNFMAVFILPSIYVTIYMYRRDPKLLERRMRTREERPTQRWVMRTLWLTMALGLVISGLDYRFGWSKVPYPLVVIADIAILLGYWMMYWVLRVNTFAATTIAVEKGQTVITTGPYAMVRHPMYLGASAMVLFAPLALGSYWAFLGFLPSFPVLVLRILDEEKVLRQELAGYTDYCRRTRYRLIPGVW